MLIKNRLVICDQEYIHFIDQTRLVILLKYIYTLWGWILLIGNIIPSAREYKLCSIPSARVYIYPLQGYKVYPLQGYKMLFPNVF